MYEAFFGLRSRPFSVTPSPDLFFHSVTHRRTLAYLQGQALAGEPLIVLTGDIGAGKTTVLQVLLRNLSDKFAPAVVVSTQLDEIELTRSVLIAFGAGAAGDSLDDLRTALRIHVEDLRSRGRPGLLIVDEAQNLSARTLRYLMRLSELGGDAEEAGLQVIISGQPGLQALVAECTGERRDDELPLYRLGPMSAMDTGSYMRHRLRAVGTANGPTFSADAIDQVQADTGGLPRLVNRLCDRVLMSACLDQTRAIDGMRVAETAAELRAELGDPALPLPPVDDHEPVDEDRTVSLPKPPVSVVLALGADSGPAAMNAPPSPAALPLESDGSVGWTREPSKDSEPRARGRWRPYWTAAVAGGLLAVSVGWLAHEGSSPQNTLRRGASAPVKAIVESASSAATTATATARPPPETNTNPPSAENRASWLHSDGQQLPAARAAREVQEPSAAASLSVDARAALGLAPPGQEASAPPSVAPDCQDAAKALGLCP